MSRITTVRCPGCKQSGDWLATPFSPFCSKRCKLVDLGQWFSEEHTLSEPLRPDPFAGDDETSSGPARS